MSAVDSHLEADAVNPHHEVRGDLQLNKSIRETATTLGEAKSAAWDILRKSSATSRCGD